jgi:hypothetical protein
MNLDLLFEILGLLVFTTEAQSSQSLEYFLNKNSLLRALRGEISAFPKGCTLCLKTFVVIWI